jgi:hypothetical protein
MRFTGVTVAGAKPGPLGPEATRRASCLPLEQTRDVPETAL